MIYTYSCNNCLQSYTRANPIEHRNRSGRCPYCTSKDTKKTMSTQEHAELMKGRK